MVARLVHRGAALLLRIGGTDFQRLLRRGHGVAGHLGACGAVATFLALIDLELRQLAPYQRKGAAGLGRLFHGGDRLLVVAGRSLGTRLAEQLVEVSALFVLGLGFRFLRLPFRHLLLLFCRQLAGTGANSHPFGPLRLQIKADLGFLRWIARDHDLLFGEQRLGVLLILFKNDLIVFPAGHKQIVLAVLVGFHIAGRAGIGIAKQYVCARHRLAIFVLYGTAHA